MTDSNREIASAFFTTLSATQFRCKFCVPKKEYVQSGGGFTNLIKYVKITHPDYETTVKTAMNARSYFELRLPTPRDYDITNWMKWIVRLNLPLSLCEAPETRAHTKATIGEITAATLKG